MYLWKRLSKMVTDRSILTKLIVSLLIIITPLYVFNYYINQIGANKNRQEIEHALTNSLQSYINILDNEFLGIQQLLDKSSLDIAVKHVELLKEDIAPNEKSIHFDFIRTYLNRIQYSTRLVRETEAFLPRMDITLSFMSNKVFNAETFNELSQQGNPFISRNGTLYMNTPYVTNSMNNQSLFIIAVTISREAITSYLSKIMSFDRGSAMLFNRRNTWEISTDAGSSTNADVKLLVLDAIQEESDLSKQKILNKNINGEAYLIVYERSSYGDMLLAAYAPQAEFYGTLDIYKKFFYTMSILSVLIIVLFSLGIYKMIHKPLRSLVQAFRRVEIGQLQFTLIPKSEDEFGYLYRRFNMMIETLNNMVNVVYEQKLLSQRSELKRLQSQINPHFLYNNFFVLQRLIRSKQNEKSAKFAEYLGKHFQFITRDAADEISLYEDVMHAKNYLDIQLVCFEQRVSVSFQAIPEEMQNVMIPRLIVQPLIENSFHHVFENQLADGLLSIKFNVDKELYQITVEDNGKQLDNKQLDALSQRLSSAGQQVEESTGIINVHRRLRLKFGNHSGLYVSRSRLGGLKINIIIERTGEWSDAEASDR